MPWSDIRMGPVHLPCLGNIGQRQCCANQTGAKKSPFQVLQSMFAKQPEQLSACVNMRHCTAPCKAFVPEVGRAGAEMLFRHSGFPQPGFAHPEVMAICKPVTQQSHASSYPTLYQQEFESCHKSPFKADGGWCRCKERDMVR